jgi:hypothetical protein
VPGDVFKEHPLRSAFPDDPGDLGPEVAWIVGAAALSGRAEGLAWISGEDDVKGAAKGSGIEAAQVVPDWGRGKVSRALGGAEDSSGPLLPFNKGTGVIAGLG